MAILWFAPEAEFMCMEAIASLASDDELYDQMYFVSQATQDTTINVGKSTVTANDDVTEVAQSFTADGPYIGKVIAWAGKNGTPTDYLKCMVYNDSSNAPGTLVATSRTLLGDADLADTAAAEEFFFDSAGFAYPLQKGEKYWVVFDRTGSASDSNFFEIHYKGTSSTVAGHALSRSDNNMSTWTADSNGYDLYHVVYAGSLIAKNVRISGGERDVDTQKLIGYNELLDVKRSTIVEATCTLVYQGKAMMSMFSGTMQDVTGAYHRNTGGEKASNDRTEKSCLFYLKDGAYRVAAMLDDALVTSKEISLDAEGHTEETISIKCLAKNYHEEDNYA